MRWRLALAVGILVGVLVWVGHTPPATRTDWDPVWIGARGAVHGVSPYAAVDSAVRVGRLAWPLFYPATAPVMVAPLGALPLRLAITIFTALGVGLLAYSIREPWRLGMLISAPAVHAILLGQWSLWLTAAIGLPWLGFVLAAKPSIGLALFLGWPSRRALIGCAVLAVISLALFPHWPLEWLANVRGAPYYRAPIERPLGFLLLLGWLRWREPEGRMIGLLALIPHTTVLHEMLYPLLVAKTPKQLAVLLLLGYICAYLVYTRTGYGPSDVPQMLAEQWPYMLTLVYLPALGLLLAKSFRRPRFCPRLLVDTLQSVTRGRTAPPLESPEVVGGRPTTAGDEPV